MLEVVEPGLYSTVQDGGRAGWGHLGVRRAGAADPLALAAANLLAGNPAEAPALEMTLLGATLAVRADTLVGLAGADMEATVPEQSRRLAPGASHLVRAGTTLVFDTAVSGARAYVAIAGGIDVPTVLGSASTDPVAGFGGIEGRVLQAGDLVAGTSSSSLTERRWPTNLPSSGMPASVGPVVVRVTDGPHLQLLLQTAPASLAERSWTVSPRADRVGLRLAGEPLESAEGQDIVSLPMVPGAVQVPPNGQPIVLMPDAPTVGGYPVPAVVAAADLPRLGQLRPGDELRFEWISLDAARRATAEQQRRLADAARALS